MQTIGGEEGGDFGVGGCDEGMGFGQMMDWVRTLHALRMVRVLRVMFVHWGEEFKDYQKQQKPMILFDGYQNNSELPQGHIPFSFLYPPFLCDKISQPKPPSFYPQFLYNEYIMSVRRYQPQAPFDKHRSIEPPALPSQAPYHLRRFNRSRNKHNTKSLQSIEINRGSTIIHPPKQHSQRRKLLSLQRNDQTEPNTERELHVQHSVKCIPAENHKHQRHPYRALRTLQSDNIQVKEKQIKDCIQLMQGVLSELQQQKSQKGGIGGTGGSLGTEVSQSKFQNYVRKVVNLRQDSKVIILRKAKTESLVTNNPSAVRSTAILNAHRFQTICDAPPPIPVKRKERPYFAEQDNSKGLDQLECSAIQGSNNQSSFISSVGKQALMRELQQEREKSTLQTGNKLVQRLKNHRKLKNVFPDGFF